RQQFLVGSPFRIVVFVVIRRRRLGGERGIARPYPHPAMLLDDRIGAHLRARRQTVLPRRPDHLAGWVVDEAVIAAAQIVALDLACRERDAAMAAAILESDRPAVARAIEHDGFAEDHACQRLLRELFAESRAVPGIAERLHGDFSLKRLHSLFD